MLGTRRAGGVTGHPRLLQAPLGCWKAHGVLWGSGCSLRAHGYPAVGLCPVLCVYPNCACAPGCKFNHFIPMHLLAAG